MTPEALVARLFDIIATRTEFTEESVCAAMLKTGVPGPAADQAYQFTQIACGRVLLGGLGIQFSPDYTCFDATGNVLESGRLVEQAYFAAATALASSYAGTPGFERLALMAAEVHAVNELLNKGSRPENLATSAPALFMKRSVPADGVSSAKPWWQFW